jgi:hypothetical protein
MIEFLENNALSIWIREAPTVLAYPTVIAIHTIGLVFLVGVSSGIALRMLGFAPSLPLGSLTGYFRLVWFGILLNVISGLLLLMQDVQHFLTLPQFYIKLGAVAVAIVLVRKLYKSIRSREGSASTTVEPQEHTLGVALLLTWLVAITAGRVTAYSDSVGLQTAFAVVIVTVVLVTIGYIAVRSSRGASQVAAGGHTVTTGNARRVSR